MALTFASEEHEGLTYPKKVILILGGARSGKSALAQRLVEELGPSPVYLATARIEDEEMAERIARHRQNRGKQWETKEEPIFLSSLISTITTSKTAILVDCLTLWLSNMLAATDEERILTAITDLINIFPHLKCPLVMVSNEVGMSIVPDNPLARKFRDLSGLMNQMIAAASDEVIFVTAGLPLKLK